MQDTVPVAANGIVFSKGMTNKLTARKQLLHWGRGLLERHGIIIAHFIPGRVRLQARSLKGNPALAQIIVQRFGVIKGVEGVEANHLTGSLVIAYNLKELQRPDSRRHLEEALLGLMPQLDEDKLRQLLAWWL